MSQFSDYALSALLFVSSVWSLTKFKKESNFSQKVIFISLALVIFASRGTVPFLIFLASFIPLLSLELPINAADEPKKTPTTIQEKFVVYITMMPLFGLLILKRDSFDSNLLKLELPMNQIWITEVVMLIMIFLTISGTIRIKRK